MTIKTETINNLFYAYTPFNQEFIDNAGFIGGRFDSELRAWYFDTRDEERVRELLNNIFGTDGSPTQLTTVRVTVVKELSADRESIILAGRTIARAFGRNSGARPGDGVIFITKKPQSGGSVKNWTTVIKPGTVFEIRDLPVAAAEKLREMNSLEIETVDQKASGNPDIQQKIDELIAQRKLIDQQILELQSQL